MFSFVDAGRGRVVKGKKVIEMDGKRMGMKNNRIISGNRWGTCPHVGNERGKEKEKVCKVFKALCCGWQVKTTH